MTQHTYGSLSFQPPSRWSERSMLAFVAPETPGANRSNIVVTGDAKLSGETLHALVHRRTSELTKLPGFKMLELRELEVGGRPAVRTRFHSQRGGATVDCIVVYVDPPTGPDVVTITTSCVASAARAWITALDNLLASAKFAGYESGHMHAHAGAHAPRLAPGLEAPVRLTPTPPPPTWGRGPAAPSVPMPIPMPGLRDRR